MKKIVALGILGVSMILGAGLALESNDDDRVYGNKIGAYTAHHKIERGIQVYELVTPRGKEFVVGEDNLQHSLDVYRERGVYGKELED